MASSTVYLGVFVFPQNLKSIGDECNVALRYQLARYAYIYEQALTADGYALDNDDGTRRCLM
jgi:hypothetical protein